MPISSERRLWQQVLLAVLADLKASSEHRRLNQEFARSWVGAHPSRDFQMVCDLAGLDPEATHRYFKGFCESDHFGLQDASGPVCVAPRAPHKS